MNFKFKKQWTDLINLYENNNFTLKQLFNQDKKRAHRYSFEVEDLYFDFSKNLIDDEVLDQLFQLAKKANLTEKIRAMFNGEKVNKSENKGATHTLQRQKSPQNSFKSDRDKMYKVAENYQSHKWKTAFNQPVETVINIGIGGSYLGPKLAINALSELQTSNTIKILFFPSVDDVGLKVILDTINIKTTLFCISSKSLGTIETSKNFSTIQEILKSHADYIPTPSNQSFVTATANLKKANSLGIPSTHIMPFDLATGGRFSVWSSIGFPVLMAIGHRQFESFLSGAQLMDEHFAKSSLEKNVPVIMALISIWYRNFMGLDAYAVIPYDVRLINLPAWLQQLMMESNGKMIDVEGKCLDYSTSPWVFGDHGQLSQHAFFQAFHQGKDIIPIDFIGVLDKKSENQKFLLVNMLAQSSALMEGVKGENNQCSCPGNRPSTTILLKELSPSSLGQLLALYEHMIYVQSIIWNINCFDQPGVELGKKIALKILENIESDNLEDLQLDQSTQQLLSRVLNQ